uniref:Lactate/malate dehydrogenase C-terminal domain-containing protein n=1 Tax=Physcomitrium patens TaxID=3218 RepID=A0A2K1ITY1_PHYPA|nr:hypothetical protein PHYPA_024678 [Physcomitrium patens]
MHLCDVANFDESYMHGLNGDFDVYECTYVTNLLFFATMVKLGKKGVKAIIGKDLRGLTKYEKKVVEALKAKLKDNNENGLEFANKQAAIV